MTKESKNTKKIIAIVVSAVVVVAAVVVGIILLNNRGDDGSKNDNNGDTTSEVLDDDFFKTDDTKIVISNSTEGDDPTVAKKVHQVYFIDGDQITGLKVYSEFESEQAAKEADEKPEVAEAMKTGMYKEHKVDGKYIIVTMAESAYQDVTVEQLRMTAETLNQTLQNGGADQQTQAESSEEDAGETEEADEPEE